MKVGIYSEPTGSSLGGAEYTVAALAQALARDHRVEIVHHHPDWTAAILSGMFALDLEGVRTRAVPYDHARHPKRRRWRRWYGLDSWHAELSRPYDVFINFTHGAPPFCHARIGILAVLFPMFQPFQAWPWVAQAPRRLAFLPPALHRLHYERAWQRRLQSYRKIVAISEYAKSWTRARWRTDCEVLHPPVHTRFAVVQKDNLILSVGRFVGSGVLKHQLELAGAFRRLVDDGLRDWEFACAGTLGESPGDRDYFAEVRRAAPEHSARLFANLDRRKLEGLFERAKIFWHATGYGGDSLQNPELLEHFGIATVEAMAAGCVPVVIEGGGQSEIVEHGVSGFLWRSLEELAEYSLRLARDDALRERMSSAARARSRKFDRAHFVERFRALLDPLLP